MPPPFKGPELVKVIDPAITGFELVAVIEPVKVPTKGPPLEAVIPPPRIKLFALRVIPATPLVSTSLKK